MITCIGVLASGGNACLLTYILFMQYYIESRKVLLEQQKPAEPATPAAGGVKTPWKPMTPADTINVPVDATGRT